MQRPTPPPPRADEDVRRGEPDSRNTDMDLLTPSPRSTSPASQQARPTQPRSSTDPSPSALLHGWFKAKEKEKPSGHRNRSPYSRSHLRARSSGATLLTAPVMTRAHSLPNPSTPRPFEQPTSPPGSLSPNPNARSPARARSPFTPGLPEEGLYMPPPRSPAGWFDSLTSGSAIEAIQEDSELDITPRPTSAHTMLQPSPLPAHSSSHSRSSSLRRRPTSPLHNNLTSSTLQQAATSIPSTDASTPTSASASPSLGPQKYNEAFPHLLYHYASSSSFSVSSMPSTPTSARSRSPSISSLETIEDAPQEEEEAETEAAERMERLRLAVVDSGGGSEQGESDSEGEGTGSGRRKGSLEVPRLRSSGALGTGLRVGERKRWSVCGAERRGDLDLETIWED